MVTILIYVLLGMFIYAFIIPILEQLVTVIIQWLENLKGKLMVNATKLQNEITDLAGTEIESTTSTNVIGFSVPNEFDYEEDYEEDDE